MSIQNDHFSAPAKQNISGPSSESSPNPSNTYELNLISQYLTFNRQLTQDPVENMANKQFIQARQDDNIKRQEVEIQAKGKSLFHNFQKHLVNTLKNNVKFKKIQSIQKSRLRIAYQLWEYFTSSAKSTKKLLYTILGDNFINSQQFKKASNSQRSELLDLINNSSEEDTKTSQIYLRNIIVKQSRNLMKGNLLKGRRIHRSQDFKIYFKNFVKQMEEGMIMRRMPKDKKKSTMQNQSMEENI